MLIFKPFSALLNKQALTLSPCISKIPLSVHEGSINFGSGAVKV